MEIEARRQSDKRVEDLTNRLDIIQETLDRLLQQQNANSTPHGSNNAPQVVTINLYLLQFSLWQCNNCSMVFTLIQSLRASPTYHDEEVHEEQEQDARSYARDDMADMHLYDDDDFLSKRVVLREEQHNEVISFVFLLGL